MQTLLRTTTSRELSGWQLLLQIEHEEAQHDRDLRESEDGHVLVSGLPDADDSDPGDEDGLLTNGDTE